MILDTFVTKADGTKQLFDSEKIERTCLRMGATREIAEEIAKNIERNIFDGIETRKILQMILRRLSKHKPAIKHQIDLRRALCMHASTPYQEKR